MRVRWCGAIVALLIAGCASSAPLAGVGERSPTTIAPTTTAAETTTTRPTTTTTESTTTTTDPVLGLLEEMSIEDKIGQMLMPVVRGTGAETASGADRAYNVALGGFETPAELMAAHRLGGVMYLGPNVESPEQIGRFSTELQSVAAGAGLFPLFIAADQEGGRVRRIRGEGVTPIGSARSLAGDATAVYDAARTTGEETQALGVNVVFAPVADVVRSDVGVIGDRSYGNDPVVVSEMVVAAVTGLQDGGVAAVVKHWPGHGATEVDSHAALPVIASSEEQWRAVDRPPFVAAVEHEVAGMMIGHLAVPELGSGDTPASISPVLVEQLVRDDLGFDGVLFTDALDMRALDGIDEAELAVLVVEAGIDILLVPPDLGAAVGAIEDALASGRIGEERLDDSVIRILRLKTGLGLLPT